MSLFVPTITHSLAELESWKFKGILIYIFARNTFSCFSKIHFSNPQLTVYFSHYLLTPDVWSNLLIYQNDVYLNTVIYLPKSKIGLLSHLTHFRTLFFYLPIYFPHTFTGANLSARLPFTYTPEYLKPKLRDLPQIELINYNPLPTVHISPCSLWRNI